MIEGYQNVLCIPVIKHLRQMLEKCYSDSEMSLQHCLPKKPCFLGCSSMKVLFLSLKLEDSDFKNFASIQFLL